MSSLGMIRKQTRARAGLALAWALLGGSACQEPTQVELRLSTDLPCDGVHGTAVTVGRRGELEDAFPATSLTVCEAGADGTRHLGLVVLVPREGASDDAIALKVVAALTARSVDECVPGKEGARGYQGCVVARRELRYRPGHTLRLEVPMLQQCEGVECTVDSTCFDATTCIPAGVTCRQEVCAINDAPELRFADPSGSGPAGAGGGGVAGSPMASGGGNGPAGAGGEAGVDGTAGAGGEAGWGSGASASNGQGGSGGAGGQGEDGQGEGPLVAIQVVTGSYHSCAIMQSNEVRCWGYNGSGQLGDSTTTDRRTPVPVLLSPAGPPLTNVQSAALGYSHSCALLTSSELRCWGSNHVGQLGDGTTDSRLTPVAVLQSQGGPPLTGVQSVALGERHGCALLTNGEVRCWGENYYGQLGDGTTDGRLTPVSVLQSPGGPPLTGVQSVALSLFQSCALLTSGEARCWGNNGSGQLGDGTTTSQLTPVPVRQAPAGPPLTGVQALALGSSHSCALLTSGQARCWGWSDSGQIGDGMLNVNRLTPVAVLQSPGGPPLTGVQALALGRQHTCALLISGEARCWGSNYSGQLGDATTTDRLTPAPVLLSPGGPPLTGLQDLALGRDHTCALLISGEARCWGSNDLGQIGDNTTPHRLTPVAVLQSPEGPPLTGLQDLAIGYDRSCALVSGGEIRCWGYNDSGQLGDGTTSGRLTPVPVLQSPGGPPLTGVQSAALGSDYSCALLTSGEARCWGENTYGQLGDGTTDGRLTPVPVLLSPGGPPLTNVQSVALGLRHGCALLTNGEVRCWGWSDSGQIGDGTLYVNRLTPVTVLQSPGGPPLTGVQSVALGHSHSCALLISGEARCWGSNYSGQLGDGTTSNRLTPVPVLQSPGGLPLTGVQALALGYDHSCALLISGEARCWGFSSLTPVSVLQSPGGSPLTGVQALALGRQHTCALLISGEARCWGFNGSGQIGDGTQTFNLTPVPVLQSLGGPPLTGVQALALGASHSCALLASGEARCWGSNDEGQLGDGTTPNRFTPVPVLQSPEEPSLTGVQPLTFGGVHSRALVSEGEVHCWELNESGQLGNGTFANRPNAVPTLLPSGKDSPLRSRPSARPAPTERIPLGLFSP